MRTRASGVCVCGPCGLHGGLESTGRTTSDLLLLQGLILLIKLMPRSARFPSTLSEFPFQSTLQDDIDQIAVNTKGNFLALGDDTGAVTVVDVAMNKAFKTIRQAHSNICSSVAFRRHRPWELVSGGLDSTVAR